MPIMDIDFALTAGAIEIGPVNSILKVAEGTTFTNNGTVNSKGELLSNGKTVNKGVFNNEAVITISGDKASFTNQVGAVLNNAVSGSSVGVIVNACGGTVNDYGSLEAVAPAPCIWSGAEGNDKWSNPANGLVPPDEHPVVIKRGRQVSRQSPAGRCAYHSVADPHRVRRRHLDHRARWFKR